MPDSGKRSGMKSNPISCKPGPRLMIELNLGLEKSWKSSGNFILSGKWQPWLQDSALSDTCINGR